MVNHPHPAPPDLSAWRDGDRGALSDRLSRRRLIGGAAGAIAAGCLGMSEVEARPREEARIDKIIGRMTTAEKAAQLFMIGAAGVAMTGSFGVLLGDLQPGGVTFTYANIGPADSLRSFVRDIHRSNTALRPLIAVDKEGEPVLRVPGDPAPGAVALGKEPDKTVRHSARQRAEFLAGFGFDVNFAPVADVAYK